MENTVFVPGGGCGLSLSKMNLFDNENDKKMGGAMTDIYMKLSTLSVPAGLVYKPSSEYPKFYEQQLNEHIEIAPSHKFNTLLDLVSVPNRKNKTLKMKKMKIKQKPTRKK